MAKHKRISKRPSRPPEDIEDRPLPDSMLKAMVPARNVLPDILAGKRPLGRPPKPDKKRLVSLRLDADVLDTYRSLGEGWQTKINETLRTNAPKMKRRAVRRSASGRFANVSTKPRQKQKAAAQGRHR